MIKKKSTQELRKKGRKSGRGKSSRKTKASVDLPLSIKNGGSASRKVCIIRHKSVSKNQSKS